MLIFSKSNNSSWDISNYEILKDGTWLRIIKTDSGYYGMIYKPEGGFINVSEVKSFSTIKKRIESKVRELHLLR